jgi:hypothetical protein
MGISKVEYDGEVLMDVSNDTVTPETLAQGATAHDANGDPIVGIMTTEEVVWVTCNLDIATITASNISHTYQEVLNLINLDKIVKVKGNFGIGVLIGEFTTYNSVDGGGMLVAQLMFTGDLGYGPMLLFCNLEMYANGSAIARPYIVNTTGLGG